jgi:hypothetical protein
VPCLVGCFALAFPRLALILVYVFGGGYLARAYDHWVWPLLGFFFLPLTTLAFAYGLSSLGAPGQMTPFGWVLVGLAAAGDLGLINRGGRSARHWQSQRRG